MILDKNIKNGRINWSRPRRHQVSSNKYLVSSLSFYLMYVYIFVVENLSWGPSWGIGKFDDGGTSPSKNPELYSKFISLKNQILCLFSGFVMRPNWWIKEFKPIKIILEGMSEVTFYFGYIVWPSRTLFIFITFITFLRIVHILVVLWLLF